MNMKKIKLFKDFINESAFGLSLQEVIKEVDQISNLAIKFKKDLPSIIKEIEKRQGSKIRYLSFNIGTRGNDNTFIYEVTIYTDLTPEEAAERKGVDSILPYSKRPDLYNDPNLYYVKSNKWAKSIAKKYKWKHGSVGNIGDQFSFTMN